MSFFQAVRARAAARFSAFFAIVLAIGLACATPTLAQSLSATQVVASTTLTAGVAATPFTPVTASGGLGTVSYDLSGGVLPAGLSFSTATGEITGTPISLLSTTTFTVTATDQTDPTPQTSSQTFSLTVVPPPLNTTLSVASTTLSTNTAAPSFTPVTASGGFGALSYALSGGTLPTGLSFSTATGEISGTPSTPLTVTTFTVTVTDQTTPTAQTSSQTFSLTVDPPPLNTSVAAPSTTLTAGVAATAFTPVSASGGFGTVSYALSGGTLPAGLSFSTATGEISGTPTTLLPTTSFTVTATDQAPPTGQTSFQTFNLTVDPPSLDTTVAVASTTLSVGVTATAFTPVTASGGFGTISYALSGGTLPTGLSFSTATGEISGTPTTPLAATTFTVTATDQTTPTAQTSSQTFSLTVDAASLTVDQAVASKTLTVGVAATPFTPVTASGGNGTVSFALSGATLPTGLSFSTATGEITGTPTTLLSATTFTVTATDQTTPTAQTAFETFSLTVNPPALTTTQAVASTTLPVNAAATPFTPVTASGGFGTISYALSGGTLPTGLNFSTSTGQITGTPTTLLAATTFIVTATDQATPTAQTSSKPFSLTVSAPALSTTQAVASTTLTSGTAAPAFTPVTASGGYGTISYALSGATLPTGLNFSTSTGQITGTPTTLLSATTFTVTATDQATPTAQTSSKTFSLTVNAPGLTTTQAVASTTLTSGTAATAFTPVTASGGFGTISYALSGATLPTGLNFSTSTGQITGTPTTLLSATTFTVTATDQATPTAQTSSKTFSLTVNPPGLTTTQAVASTTLSANTAATPFTPVTASGGFGTISYALSGATLPTGLNFSTSTGQITGTPTTLLSATTFTVTATDQATPTAQTSSKTFSLTVNAPGLTTTQAVASTTLTSGVAATAFTPVTASGGFGTVSYALSGGTLPTGLSFSTSTGQITGTPTSLLSATTFTVTATDQATPTAQTSSKTFSLTVNPPTLSTTQAVASTTLTSGTAAPAFTPVTASGGFGTISYALSGGTLPTGLSFSTSTGQITGTPTTLLSATIFTVTATDQATPTAQTSSKTFSLTINPPGLTTTQAVASTSLTSGTAATPFAPVTASGGFGVVRYALSGGTLPTGLNFSTTTGQITGTPTTLLSATSFTVTATDQTDPTAQTSSKTFSLTVNPPGLTTTQAVANASLTVGVAATPFTPVTASGGFGVISYALSGGTLPTGLSFSTTTGQITGTPGVALSTTTLTVTATDQATPTAQTSSKTFNLTAVIAAPIPGPPIVVSTLQGKSVTVDLTVQATNGPFTGATIVSLTPAGSGVASLVSSGSPGNLSYKLTFVSTGNFSGPAVVTYTLSNSSGPSASNTVTINVQARPDPSKDPDVLGLIDAETSAALRFGQGQIDNFDQHLESLHSDPQGGGDGGIGLVNGLRISLGQLDQHDPWALAQRDREQSSVGYLMEKTRFMAQSDLAPAKGSVAHNALPSKLGSSQTNGSGSAVQGAASPITLWAGGSIDFGLHSAGSGGPSFKFSTTGVSVGADYRLSSQLTLGAGFGYGHDVSKIGQSGAVVTSNDYAGAVYADFRPSKTTFIDGVLGYAQLDFSSQRHISSTGGFANGRRMGHDIFASFTGGWNWDLANWRVSPYGRANIIQGSLGAFTEQTGGDYALSYAGQTLSSLNGVIGVRGQGVYAIKGGFVEPRLRLELQHDFKGAGVASLAYADWTGGPTYTVAVDPTARDHVLAGVGADLKLKQATVGLDYSAGFTSGQHQEQQISARFKVQF